MRSPESGRCYELILNYNCNARCLFCSQGSFDKSLNAPFPEVARNIFRAKKEGYSRIGFTGGEPTLRRDLPQALRLARGAGFGFIRVQTNGIRLADPAYAAELARAGLTFCKFSFAGASPAEHDRLVGVRGAWKKAAAGVRNMRALKVRVGANILVTRKSFRRLPGMIRALLKEGVGNFVVIYPVYAGSMAVNARLLGVPLPDCAPWFAKAAELMDAAGLPGEILFLNVPPCFLKGRESLAIGLENFNTVVTDPSGGVSDLDENAEGAKTQGPPCRRCALKRRCRGVERGYPPLWGWKGFRPFASAPGPGRRGGEEGPGDFLSDNERCFLEILSREDGITTAAVLRAARKIVLCRDCKDGNSVMNASRRLSEKGLLRRELVRGAYRWSLTESGRRAALEGR